jgi:hypothetical protein
MKKSNIALLTVLALVVAVIAYSRVTLLKKILNNDVREITKEYSDNGGSFYTDPFHHIRIEGSSSYSDEIIISDSAIVDPKGKPVNYIDCRFDKRKIYNQDEHFQVRNDTLFIHEEDMELTTIYTNGLKSMISLSIGGKVKVQSMRSGNLFIYSDYFSDISVIDCKIVNMEANVKSGSAIKCDNSTKIDTLDFYLYGDAELGLSDFKGHIRNVHIDQEASLLLQGSAIKAFNSLKWDK